MKHIDSVMHHRALVTAFPAQTGPESLACVLHTQHHHIARSRFIPTQGEFHAKLAINGNFERQIASTKYYSTR
jgi:hypothetical protein